MVPLLKMQNISKTFGTNKVLDHVQFDLMPGEVHALIGENGAGKSTLMKILMGIYEADEGTVEMEGKKVFFPNPSKALEAGIAMIHQELNPILDMSVAENIFTGKEIRKHGFVDKKAQEEEATHYLEELGVTISPATLMRKLSVSEIQMVEIAKTLSWGARIIIMDEPTSAITESEVGKLFDNIRMLTKKGIGIIYISHKMDELFEISDRITVLRDGTYISTSDTAEITPRELIRRMVGRDITEIYPEHRSKIGEKVLSVKDVSRTGEFSNISFELHRGEKLGIAGLMGAGRTELVMALFGANRLDSGSIEIDGKAVQMKSPGDAIAHKMALISEDRKFYGLNLIGSVEDNIVSIIEGKISRFGFFDKRKSRELTDDMIGKLRIKTSSPKQLVKNLSGGNQQKVVLAKWLLDDPDILIFDEPTRGIDVGAKAEIYKIIEELACEGKAIIIISSEMPELIGLSHRMIVMHEGEKTGELSGEEMTQERIMTLASGL